MVRHFHPGADYRLYGLESLRGFIVSHFDAEVLRAYDKLRPYSYKADLGKYCLLYRLGGWYFDISVRLLTGLNFSSKINCLAYRDIQSNSQTSWSCAAAILYSKPANNVFRLAIDQIIQNCRDEYYGITALCPTGPTVLGRAFAFHGADPGFVFGDLLALTPLHATRNLSARIPKAYRGR